jgi:hypothetical protein
MSFAAVFAGVIERLLLYRGPKPSSGQDKNDSKNDSQRTPGK